MKQRVITALVMAAIFIPVVYAGSWLLEIVMVLLAIVGLFELYRMKEQKLFSVEGVLSIVALLVMLLPEFFDRFLPKQFTTVMVVYLLAIVLLICTVFSKNRFSFDHAGFSVLSVIYVGFGFRSLLLTRETGLQLLILVLITIWTTDICAYLFGRKIGKHKLAPNISPNKTIEGFVSGTMMAVIIASIYLMYFPLDQSFLFSIFIMAIISVIGQLGDLVESAFKRYYGVKDSGNIFPGHGGVLDRFDSLLFVSPILYLVGLI